MSKMKFSEFKNEVVNRIKEFLPETYESADISLQVVNKNNNLQLTGLVIRRVDNMVTPTIYLNEFYQDLLDGKEFEEIMERIAEIRVCNEFEGKFDVEYVKDFDRCKDRIIPRLVNRESNSNILAERPYTSLLDLIVTYHIQLTDDGSMSIPVTNNLVRNWEVTVEDLHSYAIANLPKLVPSDFRSMLEVMAETMCISVDELGGKGFDEENGMFILSNSLRSYGAVAVLDTDIMNEIVDRYGSGVYVLPSSINELIILPDNGKFDVEQLKQMVTEVNDNEVSETERLSYSIYKYDSAEGLQIVA